MTLVDTSAWIDYLRAESSTASRRVRELVDAGAPVVMCEPIAMELLAGARGEAGLAQLGRLVDGLPMLSVEPHLDYRAAAAIYRATRAAGRPVRNLADCVIAAICLRHDDALLHKDVDFEVIAGVTGLRHESCR